MGKNKNHSKNVGKSEVKIPPQKRNELNALIEQIIKLGFTQPTNVNEQWKVYCEIQSILDRVMAIESVLKLKANTKNRKQSLDSFKKWVVENGGLIDGIQISEFPGYELGLEANRDIKEGEMIMQIPRKIIFSEESVDSEEMKQAQKAIPVLNHMKNVQLAFLLIKEKLKMNDSFWKPYLDVFPDRHTTVMYFNPSEMQELKGSNTFGATLSHCISIASQYAIIYKSIQNCGGIKILENLKEKFSYEFYRWAVSTVMTRCNMIPSTKNPNLEENTKKENNAEEYDTTLPALIPFWDMANHRNGVITTLYNVEKSQIESTALLNYAKGDQIFIYYGNRSNFDMLKHNGFIYPDNKNDSVCIKLGLSSSDPLFEDRSKLLKLLSIEKTFEVLQAPEYISPKLLAFVRIFNMNKDQLTHWIESDRANDLLHIDCALETSLETKTWMFMQTRLTLLLKMFPTTLEEDKVLWSNHTKGQSKLGHVRAMLLQFRILEKTILTNSLEYVVQRSKA